MLRLENWRKSPWIRHAVDAIGYSAVALGIQSGLIICMDENDDGIKKASDLVVFVVKRAVGVITDRRVALASVIIFGALGGIYLIRLPASQLQTVSFGSIIEGILGRAIADFLSILGWVLATVVMLIASAVISAQHRRIRAQGDELKGLRNKEDTARLSPSDMDSLVNYSAETRAKFGPTAAPKGRPEQ